MKPNTIIPSILTFGFICFGSVFGQEIGSQEEVEHEKLRAMKTVVEEALSNNELDKLKPFLHKDFSVVTYTNKEFSDFELFKTQWAESRKKFLKGGSYKVTLKPELSKLYGDWGVTFGDSDNVLITGDGETYTFSSRWSAIVMREDGDWKIVRLHFSIDPFGNPMIKSEFGKAAWKIGLYSLVGGLIVGWLLHMFLKRSNPKVA